MSEKEIQLKDVMDLDFFQHFQDTFAKAMGVASITVDNSGPVTKPSCFTEFCMKLTRGTEKGLARCNKCDIQGGEESEKTGKPAIYYCHAGLVDFAAPIIIDGKRVGAILGGQVLTEEPDEEKFRKIALEIGVDPDMYIKALRKIRIVPVENVRAAAELLYTVVNSISKTWYQSLKVKEMSDILNDSIKDIGVTLQELHTTSTDVTANQGTLNTEIKRVNNISIEINDVTDLIKKISDDIRMLGLNASIEAARAGEVGNGFRVVAEEIRKLSDVSKQAISRIKDFTSQINESVGKTVKLGEATVKTTLDQEMAIENVSDNVKKIQQLSEDVNRLIKIK